METRVLAQGLAFLLGLMLGSFLNVVIARLPRGESIVRPPSRCPRCKERIRPWDNVPVLSYVLLRGRCRHCRKAISWRYPIVELSAGLLLWILVGRVADPWVLLPQGAFLLALLAVAWIDLDTRTIPDAVTIPGVGVGLAASLFAPPGLAGALLGALSGGVSLWLVGALY
ncbi:MAG: prepilin peptidase, partial [Candidatus Latescibacteria bacterium]|nr:prepilin peptidase [Candidatus Latescibacterota bacterium]